MAEFSANAQQLKVQSTDEEVTVTVVGNGPPKTGSVNRKLFAALCRGFLKFSDTEDKKSREEREAVSLPKSRYAQLKVKAGARGVSVDQLLADAIEKV